MFKNQRQFLFVGLVLLSSFFLFLPKVQAADTVCQGKEKGITCNLGDSKSAEYGKCDGNGKCVLNSSQVTNNSGQGSNGQIVNDVIPGTTGEESQFIKCGRAGQRMCTLCDLIAGLRIVILWIRNIAIGVGLLAFTAGGVMYIVSAGDPGLKTQANETMKKAGLGFVIILSAWLIVNTVIMSLGSYSNLGMNITGWGNFECTAKTR